MKKKIYLFLFLWSVVPLLLKAQINNEINWFVFNNGFGKQSNSTSKALSIVGQPIAGISNSDSSKFIAGFLSKYLAGGEVTSVEDDGSFQLPTVYKLYQNYPNPFNPVTKIQFSIPAHSENGIVILKIFDILGNEVAELVNEEKSPGNYVVEFNSANYGLSSGVYFYRIQTDKFADTKKLMLMK
jgi:hypothetical protein